MLNSVSLVGFLYSKPEPILNTNKKNDLKFYTFCLSVKKPYLISTIPDDSEKILIKTYDFNLKKYSHSLKINSLLGVEGRVVNENKKTLVFADTLIVLGRKK